MLSSKFFEFLGPVVDHLIYWGSKEGVRQRHRVRKLNPKNQLFLTLVKLKLNLKLIDLAFRFGLSASQTSRYLTTWICFLYRQLKEIDWMPAVNQVLETLPSVSKKSFQRLMQSLMVVRSLLRHHQTCTCSHLHGASTSIITP